MIAKCSECNDEIDRSNLKNESEASNYDKELRKRFNINPDLLVCEDCYGYLSFVEKIHRMMNSKGNVENV